MLAEGFAYQGEVSQHAGEPRGVDSTQQPPVAFVDFIQNHDQVGNRAQGDRLISLAGADRTRVMLATLLLSPHIPLLFMGEEYGETNPFLFFTDFHGDLAKAVREGRTREFEGHAGHEGEDVPDPNDPETFTRSQLDWTRPHSVEGQRWLAFSVNCSHCASSTLCRCYAARPASRARLSPPRPVLSPCAGRCRRARSPWR